MPIPSVGRTVHYVSYGTPGGEYGRECRAPIVTAVHGPAVEPSTGGTSERYDVDLAVLFNQHCVQMEDGRDGGSWHRPERA